jgi:hypothetical protein
VTEQELLSQIRVIIEERDALRERVAGLAGLEERLARQGHIISRLQALMEDLQAFIDDDAPAQPAGEADAQPQEVDGPSKFRKRYADSNVYAWIVALRGGASQLEVGAQCEVSPATIAKRVKDLGFDSVTGQPLTPAAEAWWERMHGHACPAQAPEAGGVTPCLPAGDAQQPAPEAPAPRVTEPEPPAGEDQVYSWVYKLQHGNTLYGVSEYYGVPAKEIIRALKKRGFDPYNGEAKTAQAEAWLLEREAAAAPAGNGRRC